MLKDISKEELELMSYTDISYHILKEKGQALNTPIIFKEVCKLLGYSDNIFEEKIGDFYTSLTLDKRFILLDSFEWDLRERNLSDSSSDDDDEEEELEEEIEEEEESEGDEADEDDFIDDDNIDDDDDIEEDQFEDLAIVDEKDLEK